MRKVLWVASSVSIRQISGCVNLGWYFKQVGTLSCWFFEVTSRNQASGDWDRYGKQKQPIYINILNHHITGFYLG